MTYHSDYEQQQYAHKTPQMRFKNKISINFITIQVGKEDVLEFTIVIINIKLNTPQILLQKNIKKNQNS